MRLIIILALLAFPIVEIALLISLAGEYGWKVLLYLIVVIFLGIRLIRDEKQMLSRRVMHSLMGGEHPVKAIFGSARNIIAGILLIIPGVITDAIAVILLLMPVKQIPSDSSNGTHASGFPPRATNNKAAANDDVIEGEFRRED